ncbi:inositol-tetrakisphosphate 1-kinase 1-like [Zingiber officinale]|uniref:inositol-tetrakisphosphate 1-kinase 1-like n=1 Tax=Zingiber officinale TaxID=94328 RepID=UPI001C4B9218|nr:inositol-tetrakisphosphate 1-kinase 1-like [Zingiber officinale]
MAEPSDRRFLVGYALLPEKEQSFIRPSLVTTARDRGIDLVRIDSLRPLIEQGPFDCVIHKRQDEKWRLQLIDFRAKNPSIPIVDQTLHNIDLLLNRITMREFVSKINIHPGTETFGVPKQMVIYHQNNVLHNYYEKIESCLGFPIIVKPVRCNTSNKSHRMTSRLGTILSMPWLQFPMVLQQFVNHGGVVFKVYVAGNYVQCVKRKSLKLQRRCVKRKSLKDIRGDDLFPFTYSRVPPGPYQNPEDVEYAENLEAAELPSSSCQNPEDVDDEDVEAAELPPQSFLEKIARGLRQATGLRLFNFDMIRDADARDHYFIIDINYFPGYSKMPGYEEFVTNFLWDMVHEKGESDAGSSSFSATD